MKPLIQKLPLDEGTSFLARTYETPDWEVPWHQHEEVELALIKKSSGTTIVGNYVGEYQEGDVFFFGQNLPHGFRKRHKDMIGSAMVVQFREDLFGSAFLQLPELKNVQKILDKSRQGIRLNADLKTRIGNRLIEMEHQRGIMRLQNLIDCLHIMSVSDQMEILAEDQFRLVSQKDQDKIGIVFEYTMQHFREGITIQQMADVTNLSVPSFCRYFKRTTKKTYIEFLTEIKIGQACELLRDSDKTISEICYESGYKTWANFSKQFKKICQVSPSQYRKVYRVNRSA